MPHVSSRFHCPSITLDLKGLLSKSRKLLYLCVVLAICVHLIATRWGGAQGEQKAVQPLTTKFIKRAPRLTKPLEILASNMACHWKINMLVRVEY